MYKPPKQIKTIQQAIDVAYNTNPKWMKYAGASNSYIKSSTEWFTNRIYSPGFPIADIDKPHIWNHVILEMQKQGRENETINKVMANINSALNHCQRMFPENIKGGPWQLKGKYGLRTNQGKIYFYELHEIEQIAAIGRRFYGEDLKDAILFSALSGARQGECLGLRAQDCDFRQNVLNIYQTKKGGCWRYVHMESSVVRPMLERRCEGLSADDLVFGDAFHGRNGQVSRHALYHRYCESRDATFPDKMYDWHTLRNTFIISLADLGYNVVDIAAMMDHESTRTTERYLIARNKNKVNMINDLSNLLQKQRQLVGV